MVYQYKLLQANGNISLFVYKILKAEVHRSLCSCVAVVAHNFYYWKATKWLSNSDRWQVKFRFIVAYQITHVGIQNEGNSIFQRCVLFLAVKCVQNVTQNSPKVVSLSLSPSYLKIWALTETIGQLLPLLLRIRDVSGSNLAQESYPD
jgi:hypothetical protein